MDQAVRTSCLVHTAHRSPSCPQECSVLRALWEGAKRENEQLRTLVRSHEEELEKLKAELNFKLEYHVTLDFLDAKRNSLLQSITEMEEQIQTLQQQRREKDTLKSAEVNAREPHRSLQLNSDNLEENVRAAYQLFRRMLATIKEEEISRYPDINEVASWELGYRLTAVGYDLSKHLHTSFQTVAVTTGNQGDHGEKYHDTLIKENLFLDERITELSRDLEEAIEQYQKLLKYTEEYQSQASCKIKVLKQNVAEADNEIAELDKLVDHAREVMRSELEHVKGSRKLLALLRKIEGNEAPQSY